MSVDTQSRPQRVRTKMLGLAALLWAGFVLVLLIWQMFAYRGFMAWIVEWQFAHFDQSYPTATIALLELLLVSPFLIVLGQRIRREREIKGSRSQTALLARELVLEQFLLAITAVLAACAVVVAALAFTIGGFSEKPQALRLSQLATERVADGPTRLEGDLLYNRIGYFENSLLFTKWTLWVAPVSAGGGQRGIHVFAETERRKAGDAEHAVRTGILRRQAVPGPLRRLYVNAGYPVDEPTYVLFHSVETARWPYFAAAIDLAIVALVFGIFYLIQFFRRRKIRQALPAED